MTTPSQTAPPLRELLSHRSYWRWSVSAQMARLTPLMAPLAFVLVGSYTTGTYGVGGVMVTAYIVAEICCASLSGRLLDRLGPATGVPRLLGAAALALAVLAACVAFKVPALLLVLLAALFGVCIAGVPGAMRGLLFHAVPSRLIAPALAIDSTVIEVMVVTAPLLVSVAALPSPVGAVVAMAGVAGVAALLARGLRSRADAEPQAEEPRRAVDGRLWRNPRFLFWMTVSMAFGHALGTAETCALPLSNRLGGDAFGASLLIAALAATSALSGVAYAGLSHRIKASLVRQVCVLLTLLIVGCVGLGLSTSWVTAAVSMIALGACTAPVSTIQSQGAEAEVPSDRRSEAFGVLYATNGIGYAMSGVTLAVLPLSTTLIAGATSTVIALLLAPLLLRQRGAEQIAA